MAPVQCVLCKSSAPPADDHLPPAARGAAVIRRYRQGESFVTPDGRSHLVEAEWIDYDDEAVTSTDPHGMVWLWKPDCRPPTEADVLTLMNERVFAVEQSTQQRDQALLLRFGLG